MARASDQTKSADSKKMTRKDLRAYLAEIEQKVVAREGADVTSMVALNQIFRRPDIEKLMDKEIAGQMKDLWIKLKATGLEVENPPLIFGLPENFVEQEVVEEEEKEIEIDMSRLEAEEGEEEKEEEKEAEKEEVEEDLQ